MPKNKLLGAKHENFVPALLKIVKGDDLEAFQKVAKEKGTVNLQCRDGTALCLSVFHQSLKIFDFLMDAPDLKIDVNGSRKGNNALLVAVQKNHLWEEDEVESPYPYYMTRLLQKGANPNALAVCGDTAFIFSCYSGDDDCIELLLSYGGAVDMGSWKLSRQPFDLAAKSCECSEDTLELLFNLQKYFQLHIDTIGCLISAGHIKLLEKILPSISTVVIASEDDLECFVTQLNHLPFTIFKDMIRMFPNIVEAIQQAKELNVIEAAIRNPDFEEYLKFLCENSHNLEEFYVTLLLLQSKPISDELISEVVVILARNRVPLIVDMGHFYCLRGFSASFETLLGCEFRQMDYGCISRCNYVPVHYNVTLDTKRYSNGKQKFNDYHRFFADNSRVPSLLELSRDTIRKTLIRENRLQKYCEYAAVIEKLNLSSGYIDILIFKRAIY